MAVSTAHSRHSDQAENLRETPRSSVRVLVVDDNPTERRSAGAIVEKLPGCQVYYARNGREALAVMERERPSIILTDLCMPEMDGLELVASVRQQYPRVPIILMTARGAEDMAVQALQQGAASYVPKKSLPRDIVATLDQVLAAAQAGQQEQQLFEYLNALELRFDLENDVTLVPPLIAHLQEHITRFKLFDQNARIRVGIALEEAISNAIHHGNLELSSDLREDGSDTYEHLAQERRHRPPYGQRRVHVNARLSRLEAEFKVLDEGPGFDPSRLPDPTEPANIAKISGRGLLLMRTFMDEVRYNRFGNELTMRKRRTGCAGG
jgi:CheY-like chemotaxis protein/anti-sigma regulatory factor (Ser/Thr protein kinase)